MKHTLLLDETKCRLFINENAGWQNAIKAQVKEIPQLKIMLANVQNADNINGLADKTGTDIFFNSELMMQQNEMKKLDEAIEEQQKRLLKDCDLKNQQDIDAFCNQDILRQRIKAIEKTYIDLKCNFMNYLSTIS
jgi:hypothetical protein